MQKEQSCISTILKNAKMKLSCLRLTDMKFQTIKRRFFMCQKTYGVSLLYQIRLNQVKGRSTLMLSRFALTQEKNGSKFFTNPGESTAITSMQPICMVWTGKPCIKNTLFSFLILPAEMTLIGSSSGCAVS